MKLLTTWKDSLTLFRLYNFKLFMLVTVNAFAKGCGIFFRSVIWWFMPLSLLLYFVLEHSKMASVIVGSLQDMTGLSKVVLSDMCFMIHVYVIVFMCCLIARPSVGRKTVGYFFSFKGLFACLSSIFVFLMYSSNKLLGVHVLVPLKLPVIIKIFLAFVYFSYPIFLMIWILFSLDYPGICESIGRGFVSGAKMVVYNFPVFFLLVLWSPLLWIAGALSVFLGMKIKSCAALMGIISESEWCAVWAGGCQGTIRYYIVEYVSFFVSGTVIFLVFLFVTCFISTIYIKKLYEHKDLYS